MEFVQLRVKFKTNERLPYFIGSQIRGALGYALKRVVCINPQYNCEDCFSKNNCLYYDFYEKMNVTHGFRLDFELGMDNYDFKIYLFDEKCEKLPYIVSAVYMMLTKIGIGKNHKKFFNFSMYVNDQSVIEDKKIKLPKKYIRNSELDIYKPNIELELITPLRIKKNGRFIRNDDIEVESLVKSIYQRDRKLKGYKPNSFPFNIEGDVFMKNIEYRELTRRSGRQKAVMNFGGMIGNIIIKNLNQKSYELLKLGELIGVGKQTVFGLGKIKIKKIEEA